MRFFSHPFPSLYQFLSVSFLFFPFLFFSSCRKPRTQAALSPLQTMTALHLSQDDRGVPQWKIASRQARLREDEKTAHLDAPRLAIFKDGRPASRASSLKGTILLGSNDIKLSSSVVVASLREKTVIKTSELSYSSEKKQLWTDAPVTLEKPGVVTHGRGMRAAPDLSEITIFKQESEVGSGKNGKKG